jgi:hypothetical protein
MEASNPLNTDRKGEEPGYIELPVLLKTHFGQ